MNKTHRGCRHFSIIPSLILALALVVLAGCITVNPPPAASPTPEPPLPTTQPIPQPSNQEYIESQWTLAKRTANLNTEARKGVTYKISFAFDKPVDLWFDDIEDVILSIAGSAPYYPPHRTIVQDASGRPMYYFGANITSFSYSVTGTGYRSTTEYKLHIRPSKEGDIVTVTQRFYGP